MESHNSAHPGKFHSAWTQNNKSNCWRVQKSTKYEHKEEFILLINQAYHWNNQNHKALVGKCYIIIQMKANTNRMDLYEHAQEKD